MSVIQLKNGIRLYKDKSFDYLYYAGKIAAGVLNYALSICEPGISTLEIEKEIELLILKEKCQPAFKGYDGFPYSACISVNEYVVHGIPTKRILQDGDVVSIDLGVIYKGFYSDTARTKILGKSSEDNYLLVSAAESCFKEAIKFAHAGNSIGDIGHAIHKTVLSYKTNNGEYLFDIFPSFQGHGIGKELHEQPFVPNFGFPNGGPQIIEGMCFCIEPVLIYKNSKIEETKLDNGFILFKTEDNSCSSHYENQVYISHSGPIVLTI